MHIETATNVVKASLNMCNRHRRHFGMLEQFYRRKGFVDELTAGSTTLLGRTSNSDLSAVPEPKCLICGGIGLLMLSVGPLFCAE